MPDVSFDDVIGMHSATQAIHEAFAVPMKFPDTGQAKNAWTALLLFGPSGVGKTLLLKAVATEASMTFINIKIDVIVSKWQGETEKSYTTIANINLESFALKID
ncbi:unnamed protein product [Orchesella dallaii]|uniref:ATPase AAA-type core domain-containing protein n=1 Tax=Orchesella dallaii TaxID=48710 RepID=A0ABP1PTQ1_9HEXA